MKNSLAVLVQARRLPSVFVVGERRTRGHRGALAEVVGADLFTRILILLMLSQSMS